MDINVEHMLISSSDEEAAVAGGDENRSSTRSVLQLINNLPVTSKLRKMLSLCGVPMDIREMPKRYNGNVAFELPPSSFTGMEGMQRSFDCHNWVRYTTSTIQGFPGVVRLSTCGGGFECGNGKCPFLTSYSTRNNRNFTGRLFSKCPVGLVPKEIGSMKCRHCGHPPVCIKQCLARIYYCIPENTGFSRLAIHLGNHNHEFGTGESYVVMEKAKELITKKSILNTADKPKKLQKDLAKEIIDEHLLAGSSTSLHLDATRLDEILALIEPTTNSRRLKKWITQARKDLQPIDFSQEITALLYLKEHCSYEFFHGSLFPGQMHDIYDRCFVFKMSTTGPASGVDLVKRMQSGCDLEKAWCCFDHVHRIKDWITMAAHVYDTRIQSMQTIAVCDMKAQDVQAQVLFWTLLNRVMSNHVDDPITFRGFMADEAQANWNSVRTVYGKGADIPMVGKERSCLFHFMDSVNKHTEKYIKQSCRDEHIALCLQWRNAVTYDIAEGLYNQITAWWKVGNAYENCLPELESWLAWWRNRIHRWGKFVVTMMDADDEATVPTTNLSEVVHSVWQRVDNYSIKLTIYEAAVGDLANAILQSAREKSFLEGQFVGKGPSFQNLLERVRMGRRNSIVGVAFADSVNNFVEQIDLTARGHDVNAPMTNVRRKRPVDQWNNDNDNVSHRPDIENVQRVRAKASRQTGRYDPSDEPCPPNILSPGTVTLQLRANLFERQLNNSWWAIRCLKEGSHIKCQGLKSNGRGRCNKPINLRVAPSFFGTRKHQNGLTNQFMWFCPDNIMCTWKPNQNILFSPQTVRGVWYVQQGTDLTQLEVDLLNQGGYMLETYRTEFAFSTDARETSTPNLMAIENPSPAIASDRSHMRRRSGISKGAKERMERGLSLNGRLLDVTKNPQGTMEIHVIESFDSSDIGNTYLVTISNEPSCTCPDFSRNMILKKYLPCKHLYFVYLRVKGLDMNCNMFIHQPVLGSHELFHVLALPSRGLG